MDGFRRLTGATFTRLNCLSDNFGRKTESELFVWMLPFSCSQNHPRIETLGRLKEKVLTPSDAAKKLFFFFFLFNIIDVQHLYI